MERQWWQDKVCYQIWPKSFKDSNGDGVGDIPGIIDRLDYLKELGADILWLSPVYKSPLADEGYDIADYRGIDPRFGTMEDMERLLAETKRRGMYVVMDLVVNHCSDEHPWFQKALADPEGPYGKYFYFRKGKNGAPPTNWRGYFGGSVWSPVPGREDLYYLHLFCKKQPDLDWENPAVRREVVEMVNWWLDKGVAGFRADAIVNIGKPERFEDFAPDRPDGLADCRKMLADPVSRQRLHKYLGQLRDEAFAPHNAFTVGEVFDTDPAELALFIGQGGFFSSMFDFAAACWGGSPKGWYDAKKPGPDNYRDCCFDSALRAAGVGFLSNIIENHDEPPGRQPLPARGGRKRPQGPEGAGGGADAAAGPALPLSGAGVRHDQHGVPFHRRGGRREHPRRIRRRAGGGPRPRRGAGPGGPLEPGQRPHPGAVVGGTRRRLHRRHALAAGEPELCPGERGGPAGRGRLGAGVLQIVDSPSQKR